MVKKEKKTSWDNCIISDKFSKERAEENICKIIILCVIKLQTQRGIALIKLLWEVNIIWIHRTYFPQ